ncbi:hypothetical protein [Clostridium manihotivorum]|uniref:Uncharacterized protein n=1 Tax=Clostridium manihotivorum TaxID=2320868 RepID=A0A3R5UHA3_9CLOT|nr:hypothetical protein [Clostridium manihotivorum]QAA33698.1 hypothetical protein C1I91_19835 [Clostridium manihotivorum]
MALFDECLEALDKDKIVQSEEKTSEVIKAFMATFPVAICGAIDWTLVQNKYRARKLHDIVEVIKKRKNKLR